MAAQPQAGATPLSKPQGFPKNERYELASQLRRAALSVPTNIAGGSKRAAAKDCAHFLNIAEGSLSETEYLITVSRDLGYIAQDPPVAIWLGYPRC
jgi:four helix bundle protein